MRETYIDRDGIKLFARVDGVDNPAAPTLVFSNSLGTTLHLWDQVVAQLPAELRIIRYDLRGHGKSDVPAGRYTMGQLVGDADAVCGAFDVRDAMFVGLSVGGMIAQGLAVKRPAFIRALVLSNTAAKIGNPQLWQDRIDTALTHGMAALSDTTMQRWFSRNFYGTPAMDPWLDMVQSCSPVGYAGVCAAISGTDFYTPTSGLRIPTLGIAGAEDGTTPADLVRETIDLIPGAQFKVLKRTGHLPCVEDPTTYAAKLTDFVTATGHMDKGLY